MVNPISQAIGNHRTRSYGTADPRGIAQSLIWRRERPIIPETGLTSELLEHVFFYLVQEKVALQAIRVFTPDNFDEIFDRYQAELARLATAVNTGITTQIIIMRCPAERLPLFMEMNIRLLEEFPQDRSEILSFISKVFSAEKLDLDLTLIVIDRFVAAIMHDVSEEPKPEAKIEVAKSILQTQPLAGLPAVLEIFSHVPPPHKNILEPLIMELAKTSEGRKYLLNIFSQKDRKLLGTSEIGRKLIIQAVAMIVKRPVSARTLEDPGPLAISEWLSAANRSKLTQAPLTIEVAGRFISLVNDIQRLFKLFKAERHPRYRFSTSLLEKMSEMQRIMRRLSKTADPAGLIIPAGIIQTVFAGIAGFPLIPPQDRDFSALEEPARVFLFGIILRLVKGDVPEIERVMEVLREKKRLEPILASIDSDLSEVMDELRKLVLELVNNPGICASKF
ncbi:hypothetical protein A3H38_03695 [candidate division WOR-1 bacterium RIFCSPLOWO2_02_FULL_46_20]|uniref:Carbamoyl phosphate synthase ATP-binding domain-containing protein n=1 Tax=candidate division WOR-1 bacterium RIFCSPLOWO2_02_FULL_46_20 TaxID=1802567 RepID=A0A1F4R4K5_UNCSA|nr:MAG: hypothetical protein A3J44_03105 [candidate division WOR-1 bacterium RIFCSPHIGHO2_02_FULL_45_12]OGC03128.1 MAG: hypothetical protein A3H38_03695 [candidate division WOR-1 bacterium RIFCSPLOWO2_02_FULL_46_20]